MSHASPETSASPGNGEIVLLDGVGKIYGEVGTGLSVLRDVRLSIQAGEFVGIIGASGSGKTTLMNILGCLDRPSTGRYVLDGEDVSTLDDDRLSRVRNRSVGFVFQSFQLIPQLTVLENVEVPLYYGRISRGRRKERSQELLSAVGLSHRLGHHPQQLSGGECQRVAIARALANEPAMILADEPTGNLDTKSGAEVLQLLVDLNRAGRTIVMVTHNPEIAARLSRVVELRDGAVLRDSGRAVLRDSGRAVLSDSGPAVLRDAGQAVLRDSGPAVLHDSGPKMLRDSGQAPLRDSEQLDRTSSPITPSPGPVDREAD